ncbi:HAD hydrolase-like protein [Streptosporangium sp. NPDC000239]|uniref:HAD hydrolase-like protein n=1 Tax=Streptosporangium sp. NPDC000239 TaxID=3154248 RepID=UPI0033221733
MTGDHLVADIGGGRPAGLHTVWIDRGTWPDREREADHVVMNMLQAMQILQERVAERFKLAHR